MKYEYFLKKEAETKYLKNELLNITDQLESNVLYQTLNDYKKQLEQLGFRIIKERVKDELVDRYVFDIDFLTINDCQNHEVIKLFEDEMPLYLYYNENLQALEFGMHYSIELNGNKEKYKEYSQMVSEYLKSLDDLLELVLKKAIEKGIEYKKAKNKGKEDDILTNAFVNNQIPDSYTLKFIIESNEVYLYDLNGWFNQEARMFKQHLKSSPQKPFLFSDEFYKHSTQSIELLKEVLDEEKWEDEIPKIQKFFNEFVADIKKIKEKKESL